ncbi:serine/threonine protein kinase [Actinocorallia sp. API 0066]|uniref:serine/threonine-protein kinase n=1 Tax=Actinocorallia sp. API 0066 TaxID=2896846 RepID=UPI001E3D4B72|nr:serine/threonine-protein kinase [Actinocorallia sp. API 0066]MCD0450220.1 serine/threonine protein kinase [Actinocorallia sp. API 0066]
MPSAVGRYRIDRVLGQGAFAHVWLGLDDDLNDQVAIKVLSGALLDDLDVRNRFLEEARILRRADSERLVRVHEFGELPDGRPYFVMSYADRGSLSDRMREGGPLPVSTALAYIDDIAQGVEVINELGVIHRDLKPSNILFQTTKDGKGERLLIADLGLAKALAHASGAFTLPVGTPGYMSPEQARFGGGLDVRADVYGVGALSYHLLAGRAPGPAPVRVPPSAHNPEVGPDIDAVVLKALEADRELRWPTAGAYAHAIAALRRGEAPLGLGQRRPPPPVAMTTPDLPSFEPYGRPVQQPPQPPPPQHVQAAHGQPPPPGPHGPQGPQGRPSGPIPPRGDEDKTQALRFPGGDVDATILDQQPSLPRDTPFGSQPSAPVPSPSPSPSSPGRHSRPSGPSGARGGRQKLLIPAVVTAGVLVLGAVAAVLVRLGGDEPGPAPTPKVPLVALADPSQKIQVSVPAAWAQDTAEGTWNPKTNAALEDDTDRPVLRATSDKDDFRPADATSPGIFVGLTGALTVPPPTQSDHEADANGGCVKGDTRSLKIGTLNATITPWTECKTGVPSITEVGVVNEEQTFAAWVRIKQTDETDLTDAILRTLKLQEP